MKRVLLTGSTGFLGSNLLKTVPRDVELYCGVRANPSLIGKRSFLLNLADSTALLQSLDRVDPEIIIHVAAISSEAECVADPHQAYQVNVGSVLTMSQWCRQHNRKIIFTSTDLIFDGKQGNYSELHLARPSMAYGCLKAQAESILRDDERHLILRLPLLYGLGYGSRKGGLYQMIKTLQNDEAIFLFEDEYRTPAYVKDVASFIWKAAQSDLSGILNLGGPERLSRLELGRAMVEHLHIKKGKIIPVRRADKAMNFRPEDTSLFSNKAIVLGYKQHTLEEAMVEIYRELKAGLFLDSPL